MTIPLRHWLCALPLIVLTACVSTDRPPASAPSYQPDQVRAPPEVAGLLLVDSVGFPLPELGTLYRYRGEGPLRPDVYIYRRHANSTVETATRDFRLVLGLERRRGRFTDLRILHERPWTPVEWAEGREVVAQLELGGELRDSYFHIFAIGSRFVKVRTTAAEDVVTLKEVRAFVAALLAEIAAAEPVPLLPVALLPLT